jgi:hypothetical protein
MIKTGLEDLNETIAKQRKGGWGTQFGLFKKFRFKTKLSKTDTVLLSFASVSQNYKIKVSLSFASFRFGSFALFRLKYVSFRKFCFRGSFASKFRF